jgi:uncharacterized protein (DUF2141 family)
MLIALPLLLLAAPASADLEVTLERLRSERGLVHLCLTRDPAHFPDCNGDPKAVKRTAPASSPGPIRFAGIAPGAYALSVAHDENANRKFDTMLGIPREGFGFSRNPVVRFGAPQFRQVVIDLRPGFTRQRIRMQYLL